MKIYNNRPEQTHKNIVCTERWKINIPTSMVIWLNEEGLHLGKEVMFDAVTEKANKASCAFV